MTDDELRDYLKVRVFPDIKKSVDEFCRWDVTFTWDERNFYGELKCRETHYPLMVIEQDKWLALMLVADVTAADAAYINATPNGVFAWNLTRQPVPTWSWKPMPETTAFGATELVDKRVGYLPIDKAWRIDR